MEHILFRLLLGHLMGDYLFQNDWMALNKKKQWLPCLVHCVIYTWCVSLFLQPLLDTLSLWEWWCCYQLIFLSHIIIDRTNLIERWFRFIGGRAFGRIGLPTHGLCASPDVHTIRLIYTCIVQTVADNTLHLVLMFWIVRHYA